MLFVGIFLEKLGGKFRGHGRIDPLNPPVTSTNYTNRIISNHLDIKRMHVAVWLSLLEFESYLTSVTMLTRSLVKD